ncbi:MAG TPA: hypothetical protein VFG42_11390 [Baekduia sp.]|uniref:hypothetical protein n=1 Tax=Baekduia sp. TaxID=2600305 RepID=UPI002D7863C7|nr:hypothetical protein [Baekduia sp.]HET6507381.1 hypothetical protein [Baekduia sp.]
MIDALWGLGREIGYEVVVQPGPIDAIGVVVWEIATVSINSRFPIELQAEELVYIMALLVERLERLSTDLRLTYCQEAQVVDTAAAGICAELDLASSRTTSLEIAGVWDGVEPTTLIEVEDLVARVACRLAERVIPRS